MIFIFKCLFVNMLYCNNFRMTWKRNIFFLTICILILQVISIQNITNYQYPTRYDLNITFGDFDNGDYYDGIANITLSPKQMSSKIIELHASCVKVMILNVYVDGAEMTHKNTNCDNNIIKLAHDKEIEKETYLTIVYKALFLDKTGIFKIIENNKTQLIATQFQPIYARFAFPCFDEPRFKTIFQLTLVYPSGYQAISNTAVQSTTAIDRKLMTIFKPTPLMSTYLFGFIIGKFDQTVIQAPNYSPKVSIKSYVRNNMTAYSKFAEHQIPTMFYKLEEYLRIPYSDYMEKLDFVAVPFFPAEAMENWGIPLFSETCFFYHEEDISRKDRQLVITTLIHEISHMWFGNLVTPDSWSDVYISEGMATFMEMFITAQIYPKLEMENQFVVNYLQYALGADSKSKTPMNAQPSDDVTEKFGPISYRKGASIFRMFYHIMGENKFKKGIRNYLKAKATSNTNGNELLEALGNQSDIIKNMNSWAEKNGYPLLSVKLYGDHVTIHQKQFWLGGPDHNIKDGEWYVPITYTLENDRTQFKNTHKYTMMLANHTATIQMKGAKWILLNNQGVGFYRVNYDKHLWGNISFSLTNELDTIDIMARAIIVDDLFNIARGGYKPYSEVLTILQFLKNDTSYYSWVPAFSGFEFLLLRAGKNSPLGRAITREMFVLMEKAYNNVTSIEQTTSDLDIYKYELMRSWACRLNHKPCIEEVVEIFNEYKMKGKKPNPNVREYVFCNYLRYMGTETDWNLLYHEYLKSEVENERIELIKALSCIPNERILKSYLYDAISKSNSSIRPVHRTFVFKFICDEYESGIELVTEFIHENNLLFFDNVGEKGHIDFDDIFYTMAPRVRNYYKFFISVKPFYDQLDIQHRWTMDAVFGTALSNSNWYEKHKDELHSYYKANGVRYKSISFIIFSILLLHLIF